MSDGQHSILVEYREISRFPGYRFGDDGTAWTQWIARSNGNGGGQTWSRGTEWKPIRPIAIRGYQQVRLSRFGRKHHQLHRLVLEAFVGSCPEGLECRHLDGQPGNNRLENLAWGTHEANMRDRDDHGGTLRGTRNHFAKLSPAQVQEIIRLRAKGLTTTDIAKRFGISDSNVSMITTRRTWRHLPVG